MPLILIFSSFITFVYSFVCVCLTAMARTASMMWSRHGESRKIYFFLVSRKRHFKLTINYNVAYRFIVDFFFYWFEDVSPLLLLCWNCFIITMFQIWCNTFSISILKLMRFSAFIWLLFWVILTDFQICSQFYIPGLSSA